MGINSYDDHGIPASTNIGRFQYTGQTYLADLGMYYYKVRIYSPTLGRFLQTDPVGYGDGMNLYTYVGGDPVNFIDPGGKSRRANKSAAAALEALSQYGERTAGSGNEFAGNIIFYSFTFNVNQGIGGQSASSHCGFTCTATFHTHNTNEFSNLRGSESDTFSHTDITTARSNGAPSFLLTETRRVQVYDPKAKTVYQFTRVNSDGSSGKSFKLTGNVTKVRNNKDGTLTVTTQRGRIIRREKIKLTNCSRTKEGGWVCPK